MQQDVEAGAVTEVDPGEVEVEAVDRLGQYFTQGVPQRLLRVDVEFTRDRHNRPLVGGIRRDLQERRGVGSNRAIRLRLVDGFVCAPRLGRKQMFLHGSRSRGIHWSLPPPGSTSLTSHVKRYMNSFSPF